MTCIQCKATECVHNKDGVCSKKLITISYGKWSDEPFCNDNDDYSQKDRDGEEDIRWNV